ncbi:SSI family serine proteinase inhibitor [Streptomyces spiramyceticus]|uniref:SSI family serine proteinase inhibitor n=1 Tax=Streptomyces spiramyceticus TaxID=299717 RepID=UPI00237B8C6E|nr:SSI family serine proteinase inhibitor [Streptomyces spiramyceticus]
MLRRFTFTAAASVAVLSGAAPAATAATPSPIPLPALQDLAVLQDLPLLKGKDDAADNKQSQLTLTTSKTGNPAANGTYELKCGPTGGTHPDAQGACDRLDELTGQGKDPFAPVPGGQMCTQQHGGDATARITGTWRGRNVDATFNRGDGCETSRWMGMEPVLPTVRS